MFVCIYTYIYVGSLHVPILDICIHISRMYIYIYIYINIYIYMSRYRCIHISVCICTSLCTCLGLHIQGLYRAWDL